MKGQVSVMKMFGCKAFRQFVRRYTSTCVYARERDFPKEIVVYMLLVFSYSKIIKLLGSNKSNYGSDYRDPHGYPLEMTLKEAIRQSTLQLHHSLCPKLRPTRHVWVPKL